MKTMTIRELQKELSKYPDNLPVFAEWEGVHAFVEAKNFSIEYTSKVDEEALIINVESY